MPPTSGNQNAKTCIGQFLISSVNCIACHWATLPSVAEIPSSFCHLCRWQERNSEHFIFFLKLKLCVEELMYVPAFFLKKETKHVFVNEAQWFPHAGNFSALKDWLLSWRAWVKSSWPYLGREVSGWKYQTSGLPLVVGAVIIVDNVRGKVSTEVVRAIIVTWTESRVLFVLTYLMNWE